MRIVEIARAVLISVALIAAVHLLANGCVRDPTSADDDESFSTSTGGGTNSTSTGGGSGDAPAVLNGSCRGDQNSEANTDRATMTCELTADTATGSLSGTCTTSDYFCSGTGDVTGNFTETSCEFEVDYRGNRDARITYTCTALDEAHQSVDMMYVVDDSSSPCNGDRGRVDRFTCQQ